MWYTEPEHPAGMYVTYVIRSNRTGEYLVMGALGGDYWISDIYRATEFDTADEAQQVIRVGESVFEWK